METMTIYRDRLKNAVCDKVEQKAIVIVGGGIAGIYAALLSQKLQLDTPIVIIEQSDRPGGLLASKKFDGHWFDFGTHVPRLTGNREIDDILFSDMEAKGFRGFKNINAANVSLHKHLYLDSPNPYLATSENHELKLQLDQIKTSKTDSNSFDTLEQQLIALFGRSLTDLFFQPCMFKRFNTSLGELAPDAHRLIGLSRVIMGDAELMRALKKKEQFDAVLSYAQQTEGMSALTNFYPANGNGIGQWVEDLLGQLDPNRVQILLNTTIDSVAVKNGKVVDLEVTTGTDKAEQISCEHLMWSGPVFPLLKLLGSDYKSTYRPQIRQTFLYHFTFPDAPLIDSNYVNVNDASFDTFRVTLYTNLSQQWVSPHRISVEVIGDPDISPLPQSTDILAELIEMGIVDPSNKPLLSVRDTVKAGFPVLTKQFFIEAEAQARAARAAVSNVALLGKATGKSFFMQDVLLDTHRRVKNQLAPVAVSI